MTLENTKNKVFYEPNGVQTEFIYDFPIVSAVHMEVYADGVLITTGYTVTGAGETGGGSVIFDTAPVATVSALNLIRQMPLTQLTAYPPFNPFPSESHEQTLDGMTMLIQQLQEAVDRSIRTPLGDPNVDMTLPTIAQRANKVLGFDDTGAYDTTESTIGEIDATVAGARTDGSLIITDYYTGDGTTTQFTMSAEPPNKDAVLVVVGGVSQSPATYTVSGSLLTFTEAPLIGTPITARNLGFAFPIIDSGIASVPTIADLRNQTSLPQGGGAMAVLGYYTEGDGGGGPYRILSEGQAPGFYVDNGGAIIVPTGGDGSSAWLWAYSGPINVRWFGVNPSVADNTPIYQDIIDLAQAEVFREIYFPDGDYVFSSIAGKSTCIFLQEDAEEYTAHPVPIRINGTGTIIIDNDVENTVWMSGPDGDGSTSATDVYVDELSFLSKTVYDDPNERVVYDSPVDTMPTWGIAFNVARWKRSEFTDLNLEFVQGFVQATSGDALYDSTSTFVQQLLIRRNVSTHHQADVSSGGFVFFTSTYSLEISNNNIERGNGGIDIQRSSGIAAHQLKLDRNTIQGNGKTVPVRLNFGGSMVITNNYLESNRTTAGVAAEQIYMAANASPLTTMVFEGNHLSQSVGNLDGYGEAYYHVRLDGFANFYPKGNTFIGGNAFRMTNSTGKLYFLDSSLQIVGSAESEGGIVLGMDERTAYEEEIAFTPVLSDSAIGGNLSPTVAGNVKCTVSHKSCTIRGQFVNVDTAGMTAGNTMYVQGLPVISSAGAISVGMCVLEQVTFTDMVNPFLAGAQDVFQLRQSTSGGNDASITVGAFTSGNADMVFELTYPID